MLADFAIALAVFAVTTAVAAALGAANFGTALGIGQVAFVFAVTALIIVGAVLLQQWLARRSKST